jgi:4-hydroxy-2-oxoheptanedioate aldolase
VSTGYQKTANEEILCIPMIETQQAVNSLEAILDVPGIDAVYIGPSDLGFSYGLIPILDRDEPQILEIYDKIIRETGKRGIAACIHCGSAAYAKRAIGMGFKLVTISNDSGILLNAAKAAVAEVRAR